MQRRYPERYRRGNKPKDRFLKPTVMDSEYLNRCMERYWKRWESFARQQCFNRFILRESYEVLMDAIMTLLCQPESEISDLIRKEKTGRPVILHWVYRAVVIHAKRHQVECLKVDLDCNLETLVSDSTYEENEVLGGFFSSMRDVTACMREDSFLQPDTQCYTGRGHLHRYVTSDRGANGRRVPRVIYQAYIADSRQWVRFSDKQKAVAFLNAGHQGGGKQSKPSNPRI